MNKYWLAVVVISLSGCAVFNSVPSDFIYETSLRGEQGTLGTASRLDAAKTLLGAGVVTDPQIKLETALPNKEVDVKKWGLRYFNKDWTRYQVLLDADIDTGKTKTKCREVSSETPVGAPTLRQLSANDGAKLQSLMEGLIAACLKEVATPSPP